MNGWQRRIVAAADLLRLRGHDFEIRCDYTGCGRRAEYLVELHGCSQHWWCAYHRNIIRGLASTTCETCRNTFGNYSDAVTREMRVAR